MQTLERFKNPFMVLRINSDPVVLNRKQPSVGLFGNPNADVGHNVHINIFQGVCQEILQKP